MNDSEVRALVRRVVQEVVGEGGAPTPAAAPRSVEFTPAPWPPRRVAVGADHGGYERKEQLKSWLQAAGYEVVDCGTQSAGSVDYPDFAVAVAQQVARGTCQAGLMIDGAGIGSGMAANKVPGVRCAVCHDVATILNSREHNDANVLSLGSGVVGPTVALRMVDLWLKTPVGAERHVRRVRKIMELEG